jgi:cytochrome P450
MAAAELPFDGSTLIDPDAYARQGYPHPEWASLRQTAPVERFEPEGWPAFWAITRHADIVEISKNPEAFLNCDGISFERAQSTLRSDSAIQMRTIIEMDNPDHRTYRGVASKFFTPRSLGAWDDTIDQMAISLIDGLGEEGEADWVTDVASLHPLSIICRILGAPKEDEPFILKTTNEIFSREDPEFQRAGMSAQESTMAAAMDFAKYFAEILADRRAKPREDLVSLLANAQVDGAPMNDIDTMGYCLIMFIAGHETTRGGLTGGMKALLDHPDQLALWKTDPAGHTKTGIEEILRYVTPVNTMARTVARDVEIGGRQLSDGERLVMFYASANRDEAVFDAPNEFRIDRNPNRHLAFGIGEHFCLGAHLARKSSAALFREFVSRVDEVEQIGGEERTPSNLVPGLKHLPIRYKMRSQSAR